MIDLQDYFISVLNAYDLAIVSDSDIHCAAFCIGKGNDLLADVTDYL